MRFFTEYYDKMQQIYDMILVQLHNLRVEATSKVCNIAPNCRRKTISCKRTIIVTCLDEIGCAGYAGGCMHAHELWVFMWCTLILLRLTVSLIFCHLISILAPESTQIDATCNKLLLLDSNDTPTPRNTIIYSAQVLFSVQACKRWLASPLERGTLVVCLAWSLGGANYGGR